MGTVTHLKKKTTVDWLREPQSEREREIRRRMIDRGLADSLQGMILQCKLYLAAPLGSGLSEEDLAPDARDFLQRFRQVQAAEREMSTQDDIAEIEQEIDAEVCASNVGQKVLNPERLFTIQEAAAVANVSKKTIQRMIRDRRLGFKRFGVRCVRIPESALEALRR